MAANAAATEAKPVTTIRKSILNASDLPSDCLQQVNYIGRLDCVGWDTIAVLRVFFSKYSAGAVPINEKKVSVMIFEIAQIQIQAGMSQQFEAGVKEAVPLFQRAKGCRSMRLQRSIEQPDCYTLVVGWDSVDDHMVGFRNSEDFQQWRRLVSTYFLQPPQVHHVHEIVHGF